MTATIDQTVEYFVKKLRQAYDGGKPLIIHGTKVSAFILGIGVEDLTDLIESKWVAEFPHEVGPTFAVLS